MSLDKRISRFRNVSFFSALLICGDMIETGLVLMPSLRELGEQIFKVEKGAKVEMISIGIVKSGTNGVELWEALDLWTLHSKVNSQRMKKKS